MAELWEVNQRQSDALERLERSHQNALARQRENEARRRSFQREATIIEGENAEALMKLQHELNRENRLLDHAFNRAEDAREVERLTTEIAIQRRDDFVRHQWQLESDYFSLEAKIIEALAGCVINERRLHIEHKQNMDAKAADHENTMELETHKNELNKDYFQFTEGMKFAQAERSESRKRGKVAEIIAHMEKMENKQ